MNPDFWRGKRVLLTGHTGFKGSWLSLWLQSLGAQLVGYALEPPPGPSLFQIAAIGRGMNSVVGDIRDPVTLHDVFAEHRPEIVFHMAAQALVRHSYANPVDTYATNVMGTVHLLEAVRNTPGVKAVVNVTTDKCYENQEWIWPYRESDSIGGHDPYSNSKACSELVSSAYRSSYFSPDRYSEHGVALATARAGNVIGGGDWATDRLIPDILAAFEKGLPVQIRHPEAIRPWQHVLEPLRGYLMLAEKLVTSGCEFAEGWNFGPNQEDTQSVSWIVNRVAELWGAEASWQFENFSQVHEAHQLKLDISKAKQRLKWHPGMHLDHSLELVLDWQKKYISGDEMKNVCLKQVQDYQDKFIHSITR